MIITLSENFKHRLTVGLSGTLIFLAALYLSAYNGWRWIFIVIATGTSIAALKEFYHIAKVKGYRPLNKIGLFFSFVYLMAVFFSTQSAASKIFPTAVLGMALIIAFLYYFRKGIDCIVNLAITFFGILYLTIPLSYVFEINYFHFAQGEGSQDGRMWLLYLFTVGKITDIAAYACGKIWGKRKLAPFISPGKTWEGAIGGFSAALAASVMFHFLSPLNISFLQSVYLGSVLSLLAQFGDLSESLLKRDVGMKDSNQLPGVGGILDVVDSQIFILPFLYVFLVFMGK